MAVFLLPSFKSLWLSALENVMMYAIAVSYIVNMENLM